MSRALAFVAATAGVVGAWDLLTTVDLRRLSGVVRPLREQHRELAGTERLRLRLLTSAVLLAAGWLVLGLVAGLLAAAAGPAALNGILRARRKAYRARLAAGSPAAARALAAGLAAGRSVRGAVAEVELEGPAGAELRRVASALSAGVATDVALEGLRARAGSRAWDTLVAAILVQREAGGDLPGLLRELAAAQEAASRTDQDARAATAQARFTARLVTALPIGALVLAELASPGFAGNLLSNSLSLGLVILALAFQFAAFVSVRAISRRLSAP